MNTWLERKQLRDHEPFIERARQLLNDVITARLNDPSARWCDHCGYLCTGGEHCCPDLGEIDFPVDLNCSVDLNCNIDLNCDITCGGE